MKDFILELGEDFLFIDQEYKVQVGNSDFYIDLLFFHKGLQCLVAFFVERSQAYRAVNTIMVQTYWQIGKRIVEQEQQGNSRCRLW